MKNKFWSSLTVFAVLVAVIGMLAAIMIPSLQRARISAPRSPARAARGGPVMAAEDLALVPPATAPPVTRALASREPRQVRHHTEAYDRIYDNPFLEVVQQPLSTFSVDVDTASYANVRRFLIQGQLPPRDAVRIEELLNYFPFDYPQPQGDAPFSVTTEVAGCPWAAGHKLAHIGLQGLKIEAGDLPPRNLVFLLDVSGSMDDPLKLPLVKAAMALLVDTLTERDRVAIVVYAGSSGLVLPSTPGDRKETIREALAALEAGGSTAGGAGITLAYKVAEENFVAGGINRVILATDGDFNVGITSQGDLVRLIEEKRESGIALSVLGFGMGNLKDSTMEKLADKGNGNYAYIDSLHEARKVLVSEGGATLVTIAKDVKLQVEFNPRKVAAYRLIGYENRLLGAEEFNDDRKDAGEIGAGHSVTALYEIVPAGAAARLPKVDPLKYQQLRPVSAAAEGDELLTVKLRYKAPDGDASRLMAFTLNDPGPREPSANGRFAAAVAGFGMLLRASEHKGSVSYPQVEELARGSLGPDPQGYRAEFARLVALAESLSRNQPPTD